METLIGLKSQLEILLVSYSQTIQWSFLIIDLFI